MKHTNLDLAALGQDAAFAEFWTGAPLERPIIDLALDGRGAAQVKAAYDFRLEQLRAMAPSRLAGEDRRR